MSLARPSVLVCAVCSTGSFSQISSSVTLPSEEVEMQKTRRIECARERERTPNRAAEWIVGSKRALKSVFYTLKHALSLSPLFHLFSLDLELEMQEWPCFALSADDADARTWSCIMQSGNQFR